ncbi:pesticin C-terminus-like muramidase [Nitratidesulfovibrio sp. 1201_IL3209]|uniref:pesticin C-terminus-like muramidase n=1 Tax=Nitratidesulfovibrio sp. 1201_IL3209 TaxID=3084053 RepID=UPI002FDA414A
MWNNWLQGGGESYDDKRRGLYRQVRDTSRQAMGAATMQEWYRLFDGGLRSIRGFEHKGSRLPDNESDALRQGFLRDMFEEARPDRFDDFWRFPRQQGDSGLELDARRLGMSVYGKPLGPTLEGRNARPATPEPLDDRYDGIAGRRSDIPGWPDAPDRTGGTEPLDPDKKEGRELAVVRWKPGQKRDENPVELMSANGTAGDTSGTAPAGAGGGTSGGAGAAEQPGGRTTRPGAGSAQEGPLQRAARTFLEGAGPGPLTVPEAPEQPRPAAPVPAPTDGGKTASPGAAAPGKIRGALAAPDKPEDINRITADTLHKLEGNVLHAYIPEKDGKPMDKSSATIGAGIDMGQWNAKGLRGIGVDEEVINRLSPLLGKNATEAKQEMDNLKKTGDAVKLTPEQARHLNEKMFIHFNGQARQQYNRAPGNVDAQGKTIHRFEELPKEMQAVVTSVLYQHGSTGKFKNFWGYSTTGDWDGAIKELRNFSSKPDYKYHPRRNKEADLMQQGLDRLRQ